jgi:hypothetical protein
VEIQTDYRESSAQTDPYSPEEIYREGERPEVLMLKNLKYGRGTNLSEFRPTSKHRRTRSDRIEQRKAVVLKLFTTDFG